MLISNPAPGRAVPPGAPPYGFDGAGPVAVSPDGAWVAIAGACSVAVFAASPPPPPPGAPPQPPLRFVGSLREGELRLWDLDDGGGGAVTSAEDDSAPVAAAAAAAGAARRSPWSSDGQLPVRLGGDGRAWSHFASAGRGFAVDGRQILAVAAGDPDPAAAAPAAAARVVLYEWKYAAGGGFLLLQELDGNPGASDVAFFSVPAATSDTNSWENASSLEQHFLVVANSAVAPDGGSAAINVYVWDSAAALFRFHHSPPQPASAPLAGAARVAVFSPPNAAVNDIWLAVAAPGDGSRLRVPSSIYRWVVFRSPASEIAAGFVLWQELPTDAALDIVALAVPSVAAAAAAASVGVAAVADEQMLFIAGTLPGSGGSGSGGSGGQHGIAWYRFDPDAAAGGPGAGGFLLVGAKEQVGVVDLEPFSANGAIFIAAACRQIESQTGAPEENPPMVLAAYGAAVSWVLQWDAAEEALTPYQRLDAASGFFSAASADAGPAASALYCAAAEIARANATGVNAATCGVTAADGETMAVGGLWGASGMRVFESGGELYLAVAQATPLCYFPCYCCYGDCK